MHARTHVVPASSCHTRPAPHQPPQPTSKPTVLLRASISAPAATSSTSAGVLPPLRVAKCRSPNSTYLQLVLVLVPVLAQWQGCGCGRDGRALVWGQVARDKCKRFMQPLLLSSSSTSDCPAVSYLLVPAGRRRVSTRCSQTATRFDARCVIQMHAQQPSSWLTAATRSAPVHSPRAILARPSLRDAPYEVL